MNRFQHAWYWPNPDDEQILRISDRKPCRAEVVRLDGNFCDLNVIDHFGSSFVRLHVPVGRTGGDWCSLVA